MLVENPTINKVANLTTDGFVKANSADGTLTVDTTINVASYASGVLPSVNGGTGQNSYSDGEILIGNSASASLLSKSTITGGNGVSVTNGNGSITAAVDYITTNFKVTSEKLNTIQNINTGASPTFNNLTLNGNIDVYGTKIDFPLFGEIDNVSRLQALVIEPYGTQTFFRTTNASGSNIGMLAYNVDSSSYEYLFEAHAGSDPHLRLPKTTSDSIIAVDSEQKLTSVTIGSGVVYSGGVLAFNGSVVDHGTLAGLSDDDHTQYHTDARAETWISSWGGTAAISVVGTVTSGTWEGETIQKSYGGTGHTTYVDGQILIGNTSSNNLNKGYIEGAAQEISVTNGPTSITVGIDSFWEGHSNIITIGTITTGAWNATPINVSSYASGTLPVTNGGTGASTAFTAGSIVFAGAGGTYSQDNSNLFWDDTNNRLGLGTPTTTNRIDVNGNAAIGSIYAGVISAPVNGLIVQGKAGFGTFAPAAQVSIGNGANEATNYGQALQITNLNGFRQQIAFIRHGNDILSCGYHGSTSIWGFGAGNATDSNFAPDHLAIHCSSYTIGIGTTSPVNRLDISGSVAIGSSYAGNNAAPADGLLVEGNVGIGTDSPASILSIANGSNDGTNYGKAMQITNANGNSQQIAFIRAGNNVLSVGYNGSTSIWGFGSGQLNDSSFSPGYLAIDLANSLIGIGETSPVNKLDVSGGMAVGASYAGTNTSPSNGLIVEGNSLFGTSTDGSAEVIVGNGGTNSRIWLRPNRTGAATARNWGIHVNNATEGAIEFYVSSSNNTDPAYVKVAFQRDGGVTLGSPTGGSKGSGTLNAQGDIYKNNTAYTNPDYAFEHYFTGKIDKFKNNEGASEYQGLTQLKQLKKYAKDNLRLPGISDEGMGIFKRSDFVLEKIEELFLHLFEFDSKVRRLQSKSKRFMEDEEGNLVYKSKNTKTGKSVKIHIEKFMRDFDEKFGTSYLEEED